jgi:hypothetical protein
MFRMHGATIKIVLLQSISDLINFKSRGTKLKTFRILLLCEIRRSRGSDCEGGM